MFAQSLQLFRCLILGAAVVCIIVLSYEKATASVSPVPEEHSVYVPDQGTGQTAQRACLEGCVADAVQCANGCGTLDHPSEIPVILTYGTMTWPHIASRVAGIRVAVETGPPKLTLI